VFFFFLALAKYSNLDCVETRATAAQVYERANNCSNKSLQGFLRRKYENNGCRVMKRNGSWKIYIWIGLSCYSIINIPRLNERYYEDYYHIHSVISFVLIPKLVRAQVYLLITYFSRRYPFEDFNNILAFLVPSTRQCFTIILL